MSDKALWDIAHRLIVDQNFRERFLIAPGAVLADLGISAEAYRALMALVPILIAGGLGALDPGPGGTISGSPVVGWGRG